MLKIKLVRLGKRNSPAYRIVVQESKAKLTGRNVQELGHLIPKTVGKHEFKLDKEKYEAWIKKGAQPTDAVLELISGKYTYIKYDPKKAKADAEALEKEAKESAEKKEEKPVEEKEEVVKSE